MDIKHKVAKRNLYIYLFGELDEHSAREGKEEIDELIDSNSDIGNVVFNFSHLSFMDSTGIGVLLGRYRKLKKYKIPAYIQSPSVSINKILQISGIYEIMPKI